MTFNEVMAELESMGTAQNRKIYSRHGAKDPMFGVSFANLNKLKKQIKKDHELALQLWESNNVDAQTLATMIADPKKFTSDKLDQWLEKINYYMLVDVFISNVVAKSTFIAEKCEAWKDSDNEWIGRGGWSLIAHSPRSKTPLSQEFYEECLVQIEKEIHSAKNRKREAMNGALISIGLINEILEQLAIKAARRIGPVEVDHGETSCKTPEAVSYIEKAKARAKKKK